MNIINCVIPLAPLLSSTDSSAQHLGENHLELWSTSPSNTRMYRGITVVEHPDVQMECKNSPEGGNWPDHRLRCFSNQVRHLLWPPINQGSMDKQEILHAHEATGSYLSSEGTCKVMVQESPPTENRQHCCHSIHKQPEGNSLHEVGFTDTRSLNVGPRKKQPHNCPVPSRIPEHYHQCEVSVHDRSNWKVNQHFLQDKTTLQSTGNRPVCNQNITPVSMLLQLVLDPFM